MLSRREVFIRILGFLERRTLIETKNLHIKMLKTALFDCAINKKCCSVDGGQGICRLFSSPPQGIWLLNSPHPREFAIQGKKNAIPWGSAREGEAGRNWKWLMHYITRRANGMASKWSEKNHDSSYWGKFQSFLSREKIFSSS